MFFENRIFPGIAETSEAALDEILRILNDAVLKRRRFSIALAGGHTPAKLYALWAEEYKTQTPWDRVHLFFGDERFVPEDDVLSNCRMARQTLIDHVPIPKENVHPMLTNFLRRKKLPKLMKLSYANSSVRVLRRSMSNCSASESRGTQPPCSPVRWLSMSRDAGCWQLRRPPSLRRG